MVSETLLGAAFGLLSHARRHAIDLGPAGVVFCAELERASPGTIAALDSLGAAQPPPARIIDRGNLDVILSGNPEASPR